MSHRSLLWIKPKNGNDIFEINKRLDEIEQNQRKRTLRFNAINESEGEHLVFTITNTLNTTLEVKYLISDISNVYRVGKLNSDKPRIVSVEFFILSKNVMKLIMLKKTP